MRNFLLIFCFCLFITQLSAQQFTSIPIGSFANNGPFSNASTARKAQMIYTPQELSSMGQNGVITKLYFKIASPNNGNLRVFLLQISLGSILDTNFINTQFHTGLKRVKSVSTDFPFTQPTAAGGFLEVELDTPYIYDASKSLIVEVSSNFAINGVASAAHIKNARRLFANSRTASTGTIDSMQWTIGFDYGNFFNIDAGITEITPTASPLNPGANFTPTVQITNKGIDTLTNVVVAYQLNNQTVVRNNWQGSLALSQASNHVMSQSFTVPMSGRLLIKSWTENPNGNVDQNPQNDTTSKEYCLRYPGGTLVVGNAPSHYPTLDSCLNDLACKTITGPTTILIKPGTYYLQGNLTTVPGNIASNPITIRSLTGEPADVKFHSDSMPALIIDSKSFLNFEGITFERLGLQNSDSGVVQIINCHDITFDDCVFKADTNNFTTANNRQLNLFIYRSVRVQIENSSFSGGDVAISAIGVSNARLNDIQIINNQFGYSRFSHLYAKYADLVRFNGNTSQRGTYFHTNQPSLYFEFCNRLNVLQNRFEGDFNGPAIVLNAAYNSTTQSFSNLIANNLFTGEYTGNSSFILTDNLIGTAGFSQVDIQHNNFDLYTNQSTSNQTPFFLLKVSFPSSVSNNLIRIKGQQQQGSLYGFRDGLTFPYFTIASNVYDYNFANHAGYIPNGPNYNFVAFQALGVDSNSFVHAFDYLPGNQLKPAMNYFNRRAKVSQWVTVDYLNNGRSATPDIGAYEFANDAEIRILGNYFTHTDTPNIRTLVAEIESNSPVTQSSLFFRKQNGIWQQANGTYSGLGNRYTFELNPRLIQPQLSPGDTIYYYIAAHTATDSSCWPLPIDTTLMPAALPFFVYGEFLRGNYSIGSQNCDFANLPLAMQALQQRPIWDTVNFILCDTLYTLNSYLIVVPRIKQADSLSHLVIRPRDSLQVNIELPLGASRSIFELSNPINTTITGLSQNLTGSISLISADTSNRSLVIILSDNNNPISNVYIDHLSITANNSSNKHTGIQAVMTQSATLKGVTINSNQIKGTKVGIHIQGFNGNATFIAKSVNIIDNEIGNDDTSYNASNIGINVGNIDSAVISGNVIRNLISNNHQQDVVGINASNTLPNSHISRNKIYRLQLDHALVNSQHKVVGIQLSSGNINCIGNEISGLSSINPANNNFAADVFGISISNASESLIAHNSIYLYGQYTNGFSNHSRIYPLNMESQLRNVEVSSNILANLAKSNQPNQFYRILQISSDPEIDGHFFSNNVYILDGTYTNLFYSLNNYTNNLTYQSWLDYTNTIVVPSKDENSILLSYQSSPFEQLNKLEPVTGLRPYLNQRAKRISVDLPNDLNGLERPANGDTLADIGAYEIQAGFRPDIVPPVVDSFWSDLPVYNCAGGVRSFYARVNDTSGVQLVQLQLIINDTIQNANMSLFSGSASNGVWRFQLTSPITDRWGSVKIRTVDNLGNIARFIQCYSFQDASLRLSVSADTLVALGDTVQLVASSQSHYTLVFSEYSISNQYLNGANPLPSYLDNPNGDYLEIANYGTDTVDLSGIRVRIQSTALVSFDDFIFPDSTLLPPKKVVVITPIAANSTYGPAIPDSLYFTINAYPFASAGANPDLFRSNLNHGIFLFAPNGDILDAMSFGIGDYAYLANFPPYVWPGFPIINLSKGSVQLMGADINARRNFLHYSELHPGSIGYYQSQLPGANTAQINWSGPGLNSNSAVVKLRMNNSGIFDFVATIQEGSCTKQDTVRVRVSGLANTDYFPPVLSDAIINNQSNCSTSIYNLQIRSKEIVSGSGVAQVILEAKNLQGLSQFFQVPLLSGNSQDGIYSFNIPLPPSGSIYDLNVFTVDSNQNVSDTLWLGPIRNHAPTLKINNDSSISLGSSILLQAQTRLRARNGLHISEVIYNYGGGGTQATNTLPNGFPSILSVNDLIELTNYTADTLLTDSMTLRLIKTGNPTYIQNFMLPKVILAPGQQLFLIPGNGVSNPAINLFYMGETSSNDLVNSSSPHGWMLIDNISQQVISAVAIASFTFDASQQVSAAVWSGTGISGTPNTAGVKRISFTPNSSSFQVSSTANPTNIGSYFLLQYVYPVVWRANNTVIGRGATLNYQPTGNVIITAMSDTAYCPSYDTAFILVTGTNQATDVQIKRIISPTSQTNPTNTQVSVVVQNMGAVPVAQIPLAYRSNNGVSIHDTLRTSLLSGDTAVFNFSQWWQPLINQSTPFCVYTQLATDTNSNNDTLCLLAGPAPVIIDLAVDSILSIQPNEPIYSARPVSVRLVNNGNQTLKNISIYYRSGIQLVQETVNDSIVVGNSFIYTFAQNWQPLTNGMLSLCVFADVSSDLNTANDTVCVNVNGHISNRPEPLNTLSLKIYPIPADNSCFLDWDPALELQSMTLYNLHGKRIRHFILLPDQSSYELDVEEMAQGMYYLHFKGRNTEFTKKLLIQR